MAGQLTVHTPGSHRVTLAELRALPNVEPMGPRHKPIRHDTLVDTVLDQITDRGWNVEKQQFAVARKGQMLFGVLDLSGPDTLEGLTPSFGFRNSTNQTLNLRGVAGDRVWLCDNLCMSGEEFVFSRKNTTLLNLPHTVAMGLEQFLVQSKHVHAKIEYLQVQRITDRDAKQKIFDIFDHGALPLHLFDDVASLYLRPQVEHPDCQPRTLWGLNNACTRALKVLTPMQQLTAARAVGREFGIGSTMQEV